MKKLLIILVSILPTLGKAQTHPTYYYDSLGNEYHYDPTISKPTTPPPTKQQTKKVKDTTHIIRTKKGVYILKSIK
jgi:hypothetical protein